MTPALKIHPGKTFRRLRPEDVMDQFPAATRGFVEALNLDLLDEDGMHQGGDAHYLLCGASALNTILAILQLANAPAPAAILDFGAGAGRVTRWLRAGFPKASIAACDLREQDVRFCREQFAADTWQSGTDIDALAAPNRYDLIWVGSVLTHLSAIDCKKLIAKLLSWTKPGGIVAMSTIGRFAKAREDRDSSFIHPQGWSAIKQQYERDGFGYADYPGQDGYGLSLIDPSWLADLVGSTPGARLLLSAEIAWDDLHDVLAIQNDARFLAQPARSPKGAAVPATAGAQAAEVVRLNARIAALETSTSWRVTGLLRAAARVLKR